MPLSRSAGTVLLSKYRLVRLLGEGAGGSVWAAVHLAEKKPVAVKLLDPKLSTMPEWRERFEREAKLSAVLGRASEHVVRVTDYGVLPDATPFLVMELLRGRSLAQVLERRRTLSLARVSEIVAGVCRALDVTHRAGVVHRDLKPANVFINEPALTDEPLTKLLDFGVAKAPPEMDVSHTTLFGTVIGTPAYMSPEQIVADPFVDHRSDLWALAGIAYRMSVGVAPFGSGSVAAVSARILYGAPRPPSAVRGGLPGAFDRWMRRGLARHPDDRFQTAGEMARSLAAVASGDRAEAASPAHGEHEADAPTEFRFRPPSVPPCAEPPRSPQRSHVLALLGLLTAGAFVGGISVGSFIRSTLT